MIFLKKVALLLQAKKYFAFCICVKVYKFHKGVEEFSQSGLGGRGENGQRKFR